MASDGRKYRSRLVLVAALMCSLAFLSANSRSETNATLPPVAPKMAAKYQFSCIFDDQPLPITDSVAKEWAPHFSEMEFIMEMAPPKILYGPDSAEGENAMGWFWGKPTITVDAKEVHVEWSIKARPLERLPRVSLRVNRFSGKAFQIFAMRDPEKPIQGPHYAYLARYGRCEIAQPKL